MKTFLLIWCVIAMTDATSIIVPDNRNYLANIDYANEQPASQVIDLVSDEDQLLSKRIGRQYYSNQALPVQCKF